MGEFQTQGFLAPAMVNFLALLGWNDGTEQEVFTVGGEGGVAMKGGTSQGLHNEGEHRAGGLHGEGGVGESSGLLVRVHCSHPF